ncbi:MAG: DUF2905 domain-containing protein [Candidatus Omnitrophica bacterium]|nr:DUF2905 domain-containing protein [Candidatus Omnitrophota bacterium]
MPDFQSLGRGLVATGLFLLLLGVILIFSGRIPGLGRLPGDIILHKEKFTFYFPLTTCLLLSALISLIACLFFRR